jgi:hypothetical protein
MAPHQYIRSGLAARMQHAARQLVAAALEPPAGLCSWPVRR